MWNCGAHRIRQAEHGHVNGTEWRSDQMLLPAFGGPRMTGQQGAKVLKRGPLGWQHEQRGCNGRRGGLSSPPTPKRNCCRFAQRHTTNVLPPPSRRVATTRPIFYGPINLAKVLI